MDIIAIKTTEEFLKKNVDSSALIYLNTGQTYETRSIYKIIEPTVGAFQPLIVVDTDVEGEDLVIIPVTNIHHIVVKGPAKDKKVGFFVKKSNQ